MAIAGQENRTYGSLSGISYGICIVSHERRAILQY